MATKDIKCVAILLEAKANIHKPSSDGDCALDLARRLEKGESVARMVMLAAGMDTGEMAETTLNVSAFVSESDINLLICT